MLYTCIHVKNVPMKLYKAIFHSTINLLYPCFIGNWTEECLLLQAPSVVT